MPEGKIGFGNHPNVSEFEASRIDGAIGKFNSAIRKLKEEDGPANGPPSPGITRDIERLVEFDRNSNETINDVKKMEAQYRSIVKNYDKGGNTINADVLAVSYAADALNGIASAIQLAQNSSNDRSERGSAELLTSYSREMIQKVRMLAPIDGNVKKSDYD